MKKRRIKVNKDLKKFILYLIPRTAKPSSVLNSVGALSNCLQARIPKATRYSKLW